MKRKDYKHKSSYSSSYYSSSSTSSFSSDYNDNQEEEEEKYSSDTPQKPIFNKKTNLSIKNIVDRFPTTSMTLNSRNKNRRNNINVNNRHHDDEDDDDDNDEHSNDDSDSDNNRKKTRDKRMKKKSKKLEDVNNSFKLGLNVTDDYLVIDDIIKKDIPREDGYDLTFNDRKNSSKQPYGKKYYEDQLSRIKIMNDDTEFTFIKEIAGAMSRSPYDLFDEEDLNRLQHAQEEERLRMKLELNRKLVTIDEKTRQLKTLQDNLSSLKKEQSDSNKLNLIQYEDTYTLINNMINNGNVDIFSDLCHYDDEKDILKRLYTYYFSYTNILDLIYIFTEPIVMIDHKKAFILRTTSSSLSPKISFINMTPDDITEYYSFMVYFNYCGKYSLVNVLQSLIQSTVYQFTDDNNKEASVLLGELGIDTNDDIQHCLPLIDDTFLALFDEKSHIAMAIEGCKLTIKNPDLLIQFLKQTLNKKMYNIMSEINMPESLIETLNKLYPKINGRNDAELLKTTIRYFILKWVKQSNWDTIKVHLKSNWLTFTQLQLEKWKEKFQILKLKLFDKIIIDSLDDIGVLMNDVINVKPLQTNNNDNDLMIENFDEKYRKYPFMRRLKDEKFKKTLSSVESGEKYQPNFATNAINQWLDLYIRYYDYKHGQINDVRDAIDKHEDAIDKVRKIIMTISTEANDSNYNDNERTGGDMMPNRQRKSFTSQVAISGIVKLKEEVVMFINKALIEVRKHCPGLIGLPLKEFHNKEAIEVGLTCEFAYYIAVLIADNRLLYQDTYKSQAHHLKVEKANFERMKSLKSYSYSKSGGTYHIFNNAIGNTSSSSSSYYSSNDTFYANKSLRLDDNARLYYKSNDNLSSLLMF